MNTVWRTIRGYILWQYERGTLHYDIMVTLILLFVILSPKLIDFNDKPAARNAHPTDVVVTPAEQGRLQFQIAASAISPGDERSLREQFLRVIEPISGEIRIVSYDAVKDRSGHITGYKVLVQRQ